MRASTPSFVIPEVRSYLGMKDELLRDRVWQVIDFHLVRDLQIVFNRMNLAATASGAENQVNEVPASWVFPKAFWVEATSPVPSN